MKKGSILLNVILIMSLLNLLLMSVFLMNKNLVHSKKQAIRNLEKNISATSKREIIDYKIQQGFKRSLLQLSQDIDHLPPEKLSKYLCTYFSFQLSYHSTINADSLPAEFYLYIDKVVDSTRHDFILLDVHFEEDDTNKKAYVFYHLKPPTLTSQDIEFLQKNQIEPVYTQYKDSLIEKKVVL